MEQCRFRVVNKCMCEESSQVLCMGKCACFEAEVLAEPAVPISRIIKLRMQMSREQSFLRAATGNPKDIDAAFDIINTNLENMLNEFKEGGRFLRG